MGCPKCDFTGITHEYEPETGDVEIPCPHCHGEDGEEPAWVTEGHDAVTQAEIDEAGWQHAEEEPCKL